MRVTFDRGVTDGRFLAKYKDTIYSIINKAYWKSWENNYGLVNVNPNPCHMWRLAEDWQFFPHIGEL